MRKVLWTLPLLVGCEGQLCGLIGQYDGEFGGDLQGELVATISEDPDDRKANALADFVLTTADAAIEGDGAVQCESGELTLDLRGLDKEKIGFVTGLLTDGEGHGDWDLFPPDEKHGTWFY